MISVYVLHNYSGGEHLRMLVLHTKGRKFFVMAVLCRSAISFVIVLFASLELCKSSLEQGHPGAFPQLASVLPARVREAQARAERTWQHGLHGRRPPARLAQDQIMLDISAPVSEVDPQFLSVTIDSGDISRNWSGINFTAPRILNMARGLSPAMLRVGGTSGDYLIFNSSTDKTDSNFTMTPEQWDQVNVFVQNVGWDFVFGLNALLRSPYPNGSWDSDNARMLLSYTVSRNYTVQWELGNEPDLWKTPIPATDHAKDFLTLQQLVMEEKTLGKSLVGPDVADSTTYFIEFIENLSQGLLNATTYHHYYGNGHTATLDQCYDVKVLDEYISRAILFQGATDVLQPQAEVWLGETSSFYDGGAPNISDTYAAGFMWLDKLGVAAVVGHKRVFRQDFVGGNYALLNETQDPLPDYWLSLLYKRLVGTRVLYVKGSLEHGRYLRAYAHCAKSPYPAGSVVLLLLNTNSSLVMAELLNEELVSSERDVFWLSPPAGELTSDSVLLNGALLELVGDRDLPQLMPQTLPASPTISLPPLSFGFIVFKDTKLEACSKT